MEEVHNSLSRPWISPKMDLRKFQKECVSQLLRMRKIKSLRNLVSDKEYSEVENMFGLNAIKCKFQDSLELGVSEHMTSSKHLKTVRFQDEELKHRKQDPQYKALVRANAKYPNFPYNRVMKDDDVPKNVPFCPVINPDIILDVQVFRPEMQYIAFTKTQMNRIPNFLVDTEFLILGSQHLSDLRDKIQCISDSAIPGDFSETPHLEPKVSCQDIYKSGFFYINGAFYNDMRHPDSMAYSDIIINWAQDPSRKIGPFKKALMEKTKFIDLEIQFGYPYVYVHQGYCEHLMVFNDALMFTDDYCRNKNLYPIHTSLKSKKRTMCMVCRIFVADWVVYKNKLVPETPYYFCKSCFISFNYDGNDKKIGNFKAYHHSDRSSIL